MHIIPLFGQPQVVLPGLGAASGSGSDEAEAVEEAEAGGADANDEAAPGQGHDDEVAPNGIQAHHTAGLVAINVAGGVEESAESVEPGHGHGHGGIGQASTPRPGPDVVATTSDVAKAATGSAGGTTTTTTTTDVTGTEQPSPPDVAEVAGDHRLGADAETISATDRDLESLDECLNAGLDLLHRRSPLSPRLTGTLFGLAIVLVERLPWCSPLLVHLPVLL